MATTQVNQMLAAAAAACEDKKAEDIRILALDPAESGLTDYFLICNGTNDRQNLAITDEIELRLKRDFGTYPNSVEGRRNAEWVLMDYVDFIVHVFSPEKRAFYGLERLRKSATSLSLDDLNTEIRQQIAASRQRTPIKAARAAKSTTAKTTSPVRRSSGGPAQRSSSTKTAKPTKTSTGRSVKPKSAELKPGKPKKSAVAKKQTKRTSR